MAFYKAVQMYLMRKNRECGELKSFTTCVTPENSSHVDDICKSMSKIFEANDIPMRESAAADNEKCIIAYKFLLLNTNFKNQDRLAEDPIFGCLMMCPPLSPYLFLQIMWSIEYEKIMLESLLHVPFDLCTEILKIVTKYIDKLPFQRSIEVAYRLILIIYDRVLQLKKMSIQSRNVEESIQDLLINFEEFLLLLTSSKLPYLTELAGLKKYERHGIMLKKLISTIRKCLENKSSDSLVSKNNEMIYQLTFGKQRFIMCDATIIENTLAALNQQLTNVLLNKIKEVDCNMYLNWAELDDDENSMISLQRSIGLECYYFIGFMKNDEQLSQNTHLIECLQQMSSKPNPEKSNFVLNLQELCCAISNGKKELMKELLCRYEEWDRSILDFVYDNRSLLDKNDIFTLLKYVAYIFSQSTDEDLKEFSNTSVTKIVSLQSVPNIYEIVIMYVTKYEGKNCLESPHTEEVFNDFIKWNANLQTPMVLKTVLLFLLKNFKTVLTILIKITIGHKEYENIMISAKDLLLLSPFMQIRDGNNELFLTNILRTVCIENVEWNAKKFMDFIQVVVDGSIIKTDDLMNNVFLPYLKEDIFNYTNLTSILNNIYKLRFKCIKDTNSNEFAITLLKKLSFIRRSSSIRRHILTELYCHIIKVARYFVEDRCGMMFVSLQKEIGDKVECFIEPMDKAYFSIFWRFKPEAITIIDVIEDYERRCFVVLNKLREDPQTPEQLRHYFSDFNLEREDFLRHWITRVSAAEFAKFAADCVNRYWFVFGWSNKFDAFDHVLRLTVEACTLALEYPSIGAQDLFPFILKGFVSLSKVYAWGNKLENKEFVFNSVIKSIHQLHEVVKRTPYADLFEDCFIYINNDVGSNYLDHLIDVINFCQRISDQCLRNNLVCDEETRSIPHSRKVSHFYITYEVISICLKGPAKEAYDCINRMDELFV